MKQREPSKEEKENGIWFISIIMEDDASISRLNWFSWIRLFLEIMGSCTNSLYLLSYILGASFLGANLLYVFHCTSVGYLILFRFIIAPFVQTWESLGKVVIPKYFFAQLMVSLLFPKQTRARKVERKVKIDKMQNAHSKNWVQI